MMEPSVRFESFTMARYPEYCRMVKELWRKEHPLLDEKLFLWQHRGFGSSSPFENFKLLYIDNKFCGFRGVFPLLFQYPESSGMKILKGIAGSMWLLLPELRGTGFGKMLQEEAMKGVDIYLSTTSNPQTSVKVYRTMGFRQLPALSRYVVPLEWNGFIQLLIDTSGESKARAWYEKNEFTNLTSPVTISSDRLEKIWLRSTWQSGLFSVYRNSEFWQWRYLDHPYFDYKIFFDNNQGFFIGRIESVFAPQDQQRNGLKVFRIVEIVPSCSEVWNGVIDQSFIDFIRGVLAWAKSKQCCAADFYFSNDRLEPLLEKANFQKQNSDYGPPVCSFYGLFTPLKEKPNPLSAYIKVIDHNQSCLVDFHNSYITKSDGDADRPNILPLPPE